MVAAREEVERGQNEEMGKMWALTGGLEGMSAHMTSGRKPLNKLQCICRTLDQRS